MEEINAIQGRLTTIETLMSASDVRGRQTIPRCKSGDFRKDFGLSGSLSSLDKAKDDIDLTTSSVDKATPDEVLNMLLNMSFEDEENPTSSPKKEKTKLLKVPCRGSIPNINKSDIDLNLLVLDIQDVKTSINDTLNVLLRRIRSHRVGRKSKKPNTKNNIKEENTKNNIKINKQKDGFKKKIFKFIDSSSKFKPQGNDYLMTMLKAQAKYSENFVEVPHTKRKPKKHNVFNDYVYNKSQKKKTLLLNAARNDKLKPQGLFATEIQLSPDTADSIKSIISQIEGLDANVKVTHDIPQLDKIFDKFKDVKDSVDMKSFYMAIAICASLYMYKVGRLSNFKLLGTALCTYALINYSEIKAITTAYFEEINQVELLPDTMCYEDTEFRPQGGEVDSPTLNAILSFIYMKIFHRNLSKGDLNSFIKDVSHMPRAKDGIEFTINWFFHLIQKFLDFLSAKYDVEFVDIENNSSPEIREFCISVAKVIDKYNTSDVCNIDDANHIYELDHVGNKLLATLPYNERDLRSVIGNALRTLAPLKTVLRRANLHDNGPRPQPFSILIGGPTGVGKTTSSMPLMYSLISAVIPDEKYEKFLADATSAVYNRCSETVYWDGARDQFAMFMDELGQEIDVAGNMDTSYMTAIRGINTSEYPLHKAALEDKGACNFQFKLVFATTNRRKFILNSIYCTEAFVRRWAMSYVLVPKIEYCVDTDPYIWNRRLDTNKVTGEYDTSIYEFHPYDFLNGKVLNSPITYDEFILLAIDGFKRNEDKGKTMLEIHKSAIAYGCELREQFKMQGNDTQTLISYLSNSYCVSKAYIKSKLEELEINSFLGFRAKADEFHSAMQLRNIPGFKDSYEYFIHKGKSFFKSCKEHPYLTAMVAAMPFVYAAYTMFKSSPLFEQKGDTYERRKQDKRQRKSRVSKAHKGRLTYKAQGAYGLATTNFSQSVINRNVYQVRLGKDRQVMGYIIFIKGNIAIMPMHFANTFLELEEEGYYDESNRIELTSIGSAGLVYHYIPKQLNCIGMENQFGEEFEDDIVFIEFPNSIRPHRDITKYFMSRSDPRLERRFKVVLAVPSLSSISFHESAASILTDCEYSNGGPDDIVYRSGSVVQYDIPTTVGQCGSPCFLSDTLSNTPAIMGFHVAGNDKSRGISYFISKCQIDEMLKVFSNQIDEEFILLPQGCIEFNDRTQVLKKIQPLHEPSRTRIIKTELYNKWSDSNFKPANLKPFRNDEGALIRPDVLARNKYSRGSPPINSDLLDAVTNEYIGHVFNVSRVEQPWAPRIFNFEEACAGVHGVPFCEALPRNTSPGYPYVLSTRKQGKKDFFGVDGDYDFSSPMALALRQDVDQFLSNARLGIRSPVYYTDFLKDERRPIAKVDAGKTRYVSSSPLHYTIAARMYFMDLVRWCCDNRILNGICIGVNPFSSDWQIIDNVMHVHGARSFAGDFGNYDGSLFSEVMNKMLKLSEAYYSNATDEENLIRKVIFADVVNSRHIAKGNIYEWHGSVPSGTFLTTFVNSVCNNILLRYCIVAAKLRSLNVAPLGAFPDQYVPIVEQLASNVSIVTYGDDNGVNVSEYFEVANQNAMSFEFGLISMKYTDETKALEMANFRPWRDCTFLKRAFVFDRQYMRVICPLDLSVVLEAPYWTKDNAPIDGVYATVQTMLFELALHGQDAFLEYSPKIIRYSTELLNYYPKIITYRDCKAGALSLVSYF